MPRRSDYGKKRGAYRPRAISRTPSKYAELFSLGLSNAEIGRRFSVTGEAVRQIRKKYFSHLPARMAERKTQTKERKAAARFKNVFWFRRMVRRWLAAEGYFQCGRCRKVKCRALEATKGNMRCCKSCTAANSRRWYHADGKEKTLAWQDANPDKVAKIQARYRLKRSASA